MCYTRWRSISDAPTIFKKYSESYKQKETVMTNFVGRKRCRHSLRKDVRIHPRFMSPPLPPPLSFCPLFVSVLPLSFLLSSIFLLPSVVHLITHVIRVNIRSFSLYTSSSLLIALCHWLLIIEKFKPSAHCACAVPLIDGLGQEYAFTRGVYASSSQRV